MKATLTSQSSRNGTDKNAYKYVKKKKSHKDVKYDKTHNEAVNQEETSHKDVKKKPHIVVNQENSHRSVNKETSHKHVKKKSHKTVKV